MGMPNIVNSRKRLKLLYTVKGICPEFDSSEKDKRCPHVGVGTLSLHSSNTDRVANCLDVECACQSSVAGARATTVTMYQPIVVLLVLVHTPSHP